MRTFHRLQHFIDAVAERYPHLTDWTPHIHKGQVIIYADDGRQCVLFEDMAYYRDKVSLTEEELESSALFIQRRSKVSIGSKFFWMLDRIIEDVVNIKKDDARRQFKHYFLWDATKRNFNFSAPLAKYLNYCVMNDIIHYSYEDSIKAFRKQSINT